MRKPLQIFTRWLGAAAIFSAVAALDVAGLLGPADRALMDLRFRILERPASGDVVIVQIDPYSLSELDVWPWPRRYHAQLIDRLMAAGAREIAIDIDLSANSTLEDDQALAAALARAGGRVILPAFRQRATPESARGRVFDTWPRPEFMARAQVGSINVTPAPDGLIRRISDLQFLGNQRVPAMFALLAGPAAIADRPFFIDYGIDPNTIPRLSYADVLRGRVAAGQLEGKSVIVGTTAAELGDALPVPLYRSMAGPAVQAMAFESVRQGRDLLVFGSALSIPVSAVLVVLFTVFLGRQPWRWAVLVCGVAIIAIEGGAIMLQAVAPIALTTAPWICVAAVSLLCALSRDLRTQARQILLQRETIATRRALMDRMVENSFDGIIIADQDGKIQIMNKAAGVILNVSVDEAIGQPLERILPGARHLAASVPSNWGENKNMSEQWVPRECITTRRGGGRVAIEVTVGAVDLTPSAADRHDVADAPTYRTFTFRDISERMAAQEAQKRAADEALAANRAKTEFLANMSHELRTPLNAIIGFSDTIRSEVHGPIKPLRYREYVQDIHDSGTHLLQVISDILDVSRIELDRYELAEDEVDLAATLRSCAKIAAGWPSFAERNFTVDLADPMPRIHGDGRVIKQVVVNLLSNAFKYSLAGDSIELLGRVDGQGRPVIAIKDSGIGIARDNLPNLTKAFYQVNGSVTREAEGVGLGLFLSARYIKRHGGELLIDSELGVGTTVTIRLPAERVIGPSEEIAVSA